MPLDDAFDDLLRLLDPSKQQGVHRPVSIEYSHHCVDLGIGGGIRIIDGDRAAAAYANKVEMEEGVRLEMPDVGMLPLPFIEGSISFPASLQCKNPSPWRLEVVGQGMSSSFVPNQTGIEHVPVYYSSIEVDAETDWEYYFGTYLSGGIGASYTPKITFTIPHVGITVSSSIRGRVGFISLKNKLDLHVEMEDLPALFDIMGQEEVERSFGFYYETSTRTRLRGIGWYAEPALVLQFHRNRFTLQTSYGVRQEALPITVAETTSYGEQFTTTKTTHVVADTSGNVFTATFNYSF